VNRWAYFHVIRVFSIGLLIIGVSLGCRLSDTLFAPPATPDVISQRDIDIVVLTEDSPGDLFEIGEIVALRDREGFQIWTHQANFWKSGEDWDPSSLSVNVVFDGNRPVEPFVFWANGSLQNVYDSTGERLGSYLASPMTINVSVAGFDIGDHMMTVSIETPNGEIFSQSWDFVIRQRETPRRTTPIELFPTAEHLAQFPHPTPEYIMRVSNEATGLDRFSPIGSGEGLCLALTDAPFVSASTAENPFRPSAWDAITLSFDNVALDGDRVGIQANDTVGHRFVCGDTDALASGTHMATITIEVDAIEYVYSWAFVVP
jgi:hypothetical protein